MKKIISSKINTTVDSIVGTLVHHHKVEVQGEIENLGIKLEEKKLNLIAEYFTKSATDIEEYEFAIDDDRNEILNTLNEAHSLKYQTAWEQVYSQIDEAQKKIIDSHSRILISQIGEIEQKITAIVFNELEKAIDNDLELKENESSYEYYQRKLNNAWNTIDIRLEEEKKQLINNYCGKS